MSSSPMIATNSSVVTANTPSSSVAAVAAADGSTTISRISSSNKLMKRSTSFNLNGKRKSLDMPPPPPTVVVETRTASAPAVAAAASTSYYDKGSIELAVETPVMMERLEKRRKFTASSANDGAECLVIVLVGLPARGKSFIARKLLNCLTWRGNQCKIFNVGKYRRKLAEMEEEEEEAQVGANLIDEKKDDDLSSKGGIMDKTSAKLGVIDEPSSSIAAKPKTCKAEFFDDSNQQAAKMRQEAAAFALKELLDWLDENGTNSGKNGMVSMGSSSSLLTTSSSFGSGLDLQQLDTSTIDVTSGLDSHSTRRQYHRIAIFDATNSTKERRRWILTECAKRTEQYQHNLINKRIGVLFIESICNDPELLAENHRVKISSCPDFHGMTQEEALEDLQTRIEKYESRYETIDDDAHKSYIKIYNLSSRLMVNHVYGRLAKVVLPAIMAWNTGSRPIYLCRAGETAAMEEYMKQQEKARKNNGNDHGKTATKLQSMMVFERKRSDRLGPRGLRFRDALCEFIEKEGMDFMNRRNDTVIHPTKMDTGTSISGLYEERDHSFAHQAKPMSMQRRLRRQNRERKPPSPTPPVPATSPALQQHVAIDDVSTNSNGSSSGNNAPLFPCLVMSSTLPRAVETATWKQHPFPVKDVSNLNPLDMGDFIGMDLETIQRENPEWYEQLKREPFYTRFPGGESYSDLIDRLYSVVLDIEQQLGLAVVVSHVSVLQVLVSYFRSSPIQECMDIEIPMHSVLKFTPLRGGGWLETQHKLLPDDVDPEIDTGLNFAETEKDEEPKPIWGDSRSCLPHRLSIDQS